MGAETPAASGNDVKPAVKIDGKPSGRNNNRRDNNYNKKEKFLGADPNLRGHVFEAKRNRSEQVANFKVVDDIIRAQVGTECDPYVLESLDTETLTLPDEPDAPKKITIGTGEDEKKVYDEIDKIKWKSRFDRYLSRVDKIESQLKQIYSKYYGQCDEDMKDSLNEDPEFEKTDKAKDVIKLRKILKRVNFSYRRNEEPIKTLWSANRDFTNMKQYRMTPTEYYEKFKSLHKVVDELNGTSLSDTCVDIICKETGKEKGALTDDEKTKMAEEGEERMLAMQLLLNSDREQYGSLIEEFDRDFLSGINKYPKTLHEAYNLLKGWNKKKIGNKNYRVGLAFNTMGEEEEEYNGPPCARCGRKSHPTEKCFAKKHANGTVLHIIGDMAEVEDISDDKVSNASDMFTGPCPTVKPYCGYEYTEDEELMLLQNDVNSLKEASIMSSKSKTSIPESWILLDSQSTIDVFSNVSLLTKVHETNTTLSIRCNAGVKTTKYRGHLSGYGWVWYYPDGIANILSLSRVRERYRVTFDSAMDNCFHIHKDNGKLLKFKEATRRLYYFDTMKRDEEASVFITTVEDNKSKLSAYDFSQAKRARALQRRIGRPSTKDYVRYVSDKFIPNCPITTQDIRNAEFV